MDNREFWVKLASSDSTTIKEVHLVCDAEDAIHPWAVSITAKRKRRATCLRTASKTA
jgi:hypothetical protein